jgi:MFS family permease
MSAQTDTPAAAPTAHAGVRGLTIAVVLAAVTVVAGALQIMVVPLLSTIGSALHEQPNAVNWTLIAAQLAAAAATPVLGRLGDQFGHRRMILAAVAIMLVGCLVSAVSQSLAVLITGRALQGVGAAATPLAIGLVRKELPPAAHHRGIAIVTSGAGVGVGLGFIIGGLLDGWRDAFWVGLAASAVCAVLVCALVPGRSQPAASSSSRASVDWVGVTLLVAGLVALLLPISEGADWGWTSGTTLGLFAAAIVLFAVFGLFELRRDDPLVDLRLLRTPPVLVPNVVALLFGICMGAGFLLWVGYAETPPQLGYGFGSSVLEAGTFLLPNAIAVLIVAPFAGAIAKKVGPAPLLIAGMLIGIVTFALLAGAHDEKWQLYAGSAAWGTAVALALVSLFLFVAQSVPASEAGAAAGITSLAQSVGSAAGSAIFTAVLTATYIPRTPVPAASGYTHAFTAAAIFAGVGLAGALVAVAVRRGHASPDGVAPDAALAG